MASERALEIARAIRKEYEVGKSSKFCEQADFDIASEEDLAKMIDEALQKYEHSFARQRLADIQARMDRADPRRAVNDILDLFRCENKQKVSTLHCDCGETFSWAGADPSVDAWILAHKPHLKTASPSAKTARFERSAVASPCNCTEAPSQHVHTPAGIMNYRAKE